MIKIKFEINNNELTRVDSQPIIAKSKHSYIAVFDFEGPLLKDVEKIAIFTDAWGESSRMYIGKYDCKCLIPDKVLSGTYFTVTVYGGDLITTNDVTIPLVHSNYKKINLKE